MKVLLFFLLLFSILNGSPAPSSLELLTADFEVLARITNAISLQAGFIQKTIPPREAILEMIGIIPDQYAEMTEVDFEEAIGRFRHLKKSIDTINGAMGAETLVKYLKDLKVIDITKNWTQEAEAMDAQLKTNLTQLKGNHSFLGKCQWINTDVLWIIRNKRLNPSAYNPNMPQTVSSFVQNLSSLATCVGDLQDYGNRLGKLSLPNLDNFLNDYLRLNESLANLPEISHAIAHEINITSAIWSRNFSGEYADRVRIGWMNHLAHTQQLSQLHPTYTAAFRGDLLKVDEDLGSRWFSKNFQKGADLKNLKKGLEGFRKMAKAFGEVEKRWKHVANKTDPEFHFKLRGPNTILMYIEFFFTDHGRPKVGVANCSNTPGDPDLIKKYKAQESGPREVVISLSTLSRFVRDLPRLLVNDTVGCLNVTHQAVKGYSIQTDADVDEIVEKMGDEFLKCSGMELDAFLELFSMLKEKQERVIKALDVSGIVVGRIPVGEVVQKIGAEETIQCLRAQNFSVNILQRMVEIFLAFYKYYRPEKFVLMIEYLENVEAVKKAVLNVEKVIRDHRSMPNNPVLRLNNSKFYAENLAISTSALTKLIEVRNNRKKLLEVGTHFTEFIHQKMTAQGIIGDFHSPQFHVAGLVKQADEIEKRAKELVGSDVETMTRIFVDVANVKGVVGQRELLRTLIAYHSNDPNFDKNVLAEWQTLVDNDLDFSYYSTPLKRGPSAVVAIEDYFDRIFGRKTDGNTKTVVVREGSWLSVILISIGFILLVFILILVIYGFTKNGREKYEDWYIFYFGKPHHFEKRWRYSAFTDVEDGKNALHDALREINDVNLKKQLRKGAYIKAYNKFGNTALHVATKAGHPELVEMLIRHGADRRLLNVKNRTPEQCIPSEIAPEDVENYRRIEEIYRKYQKKQFRIRVPPRFPPSSFHIFVDETVDVNLTNQFMEKFKSTVNLELIPTTTHFVVKTDPNGILETENFSLLSFLFSGAIMVKDTWIAACIADEQAMSQDSKYLVEKIKYRGIVYDTVTQWSAAAAKSEIPYLFGVQVALVMKECNRFDFYENLVAKHGGVLASTFPLKQNYRVGSHPYLHAHLGPLFLIHDGKIDLTGYETEKMYTLFTEEEFIRFMLRREIVRDTSKNPITVSINEE